MKRYRVIHEDFDTRATILKMQIKDDWEDKVKQLWKQNKNNIIEGLKIQYGVENFQEKYRNFLDIDVKPFSIISYHNAIIHQIRNAYVVGGYYPALTGSCALGERILNHLIIDLRDGYRPQNYQPPIDDTIDIYACKSCTKWNLMIGTIDNWGVFYNGVAKSFKELAEMRHKSLHFNPNTVSDIKNRALESILLIQSIIQRQFASIGNPEIFIPTNGEVFLKKEVENNPFIKKFYIPVCHLVSPYHEIESVLPLKIRDRSNIKDTEISDEDFVRIREEHRSGKLKGEDTTTID